MSSKNNPDNRNKKDNNKKLCPCGGEMKQSRVYAIKNFTVEVPIDGIDIVSINNERVSHGQVVWSCEICGNKEKVK